ncbi:unnamed protein product, partial [Ascophyllum nodosum]
MIGVMVGGYSWSDSSASDGEETIDVSLARKVFQLVQGLDARLARYFVCDRSEESSRDLCARSRGSRTRSSSSAKT